MNEGSFVIHQPSIQQQQPEHKVTRDLLIRYQKWKFEVRLVPMSPSSTALDSCCTFCCSSLMGSPYLPSQPLLFAPSSWPRAHILKPAPTVESRKNDIERYRSYLLPKRKAEKHGLDPKQEGICKQLR